MNFLKGSFSALLNDSLIQIDFEKGDEFEHQGINFFIELEKFKGGTSYKVKINPLGKKLLMKDFSLTFQYNFLKDDNIFCNGFQSWTDSREFLTNEKIDRLSPLLKFIGLSQYGDYNFQKYPASSGKLHAFNYAYIRRGEDLTFVGSIDETSGYTVINFDTTTNSVKIAKECDGLAIEDDFILLNFVILNGKEDFVFDKYFSMQELTPLKNKQITGWTSWYNYYTEISEKIIIENLNSFSEKNIPIDFFQIDDGYQIALGDWLKIKSKFPKGMKFIAEEIHAKDYKAGLWLAPFVCEKISRIYHKHYDWILKDKRGKPVYAGFNPGWSGKFYALDIYNEEFRKYLKKVFNVVLNDWNFDLVKLDFLYAAAIIPREGKSRGKVMADAMVFLRECVGDKLILGCGVPLGQSFGLVDYCRIGSDVALKWEDWKLNFLHYRERVSVINSLRSTIGRRHLNKNVFINDPDVFILREEGNSLTLTEKKSLFILNNVFGGLIFTSDNISLYDEKTLSLYRAMFPLKEKSKIQVEHSSSLYFIKFVVDKKEYLVFSNFSNKKRKIFLDNGIYFGGKHSSFLNNEFVDKIDYSLTPHETVVLVRVNMDSLDVIASENHIFPGSEVESISHRGRKIKVKLNEKIESSMLYIAVLESGEYLVNEESVAAEAWNNYYFIKIKITK